MSLSSLSGSRNGWKRRFDGRELRGNAARPANQSGFGAVPAGNDGG
jgi:hypothetical protein